MNSNDLFSIDLPQNRAVLWIQGEIKRNTNVKLYMLDLIQKRSLIICDYDGSEIEEEKILIVD